MTFDFRNSGSIPMGATGSVPRPRAFGSALPGDAELPIERDGVGVLIPWHPTRPDHAKIKSHTHMAPDCRAKESGRNNLTEFMRCVLLPVCPTVLLSIASDASSTCFLLS